MQVQHVPFKFRRIRFDPMTTHGRKAGGGKWIGSLFSFLLRDGFGWALWEIFWSSYLGTGNVGMSIGVVIFGEFMRWIVQIGSTGLGWCRGG